ncbi:MAG TPA: T9SS type B sorting domain-containing protein [Flavobacterium sp.]|uniref:T9SS type B sorting domain-containing protein n=1 Tax=Flavobacterium sp. TaxID=239 RepID=UPI002CFC9828|nr:T9SS type B sorting domain-containing protein [Flavobacterium sp.]HSD15315.1 T9SS type B sorting domain-containing protein [Flavobacterium sp.]
MKKTLLILLFLFISIQIHSQRKNNQSGKHHETLLSKKIEDLHGVLLTDSVQRSLFFQKRAKELRLNNSKKANLVAAHLCSNSNFEEFETQSGTNVLKNFLYTTADPYNPTQCVTPITTANQYIPQYDPAAPILMAGTVPSNYIDEFIGDIAASDQFALKINHKESGITSGIVQGKRFKTNNENELLFNYKVVLQSIEESGHTDEQPFFKARIIRNNGTVVDEFCLIGDPDNCIFTQAPNFEAGSIVLYTQNWQSGSLDISSIPNNEEFTVEFTAARCGLGGHFGYAYLEDLCSRLSNENLQGSIELDPLYKICPTLPLSVCGRFTIPNSGGVAANVDSITLNVYNDSNVIIYTTSTTTSLDLNNKTFCFQIDTSNLPNITTGNYNVGVTINYGLTQTNCSGANFTSATDSDANPGWDIAFMNCTANCNFTLQTGTLKMCDTNDDGKEFFNLTTIDPQLIGAQTGLTLAYFTSVSDATNNTNPIVNFNNYESYTSTLFARITSADPNCFKIIAFSLTVKNPAARISGILNVCNGSTTLTASPGVSYLWSNGATTQSTSITTNGTHSVSVTDADGCTAEASVNIIPTNVAVSPTIAVTQPTCFVNTGTIQVTSPAAEFSFDGGTTWTTNPTLSNVAIGSYNIKIKTINNCYSYNSLINIVPFESPYPHYSSTNPTSCDGTGSITITTVAAEYSFDDGVTWTTNNTASNLPLGIYLIRTRDANGCISDFNNIVLSGEFLPSPTYTFTAPYCSNPGSITITLPGDEFSIDGGTTWQTSNTFDNLTPGSYVIKVRTAQGCTSPNVYVYLTRFENTSPSYTIDEAGCDKYATLTITTTGDYYSFDGGATWTTNNILSNLNGGASIAIKVKKDPNCVTYTTTAHINSQYHPLPSLTSYETLICDNQNNGDERVNLTNFNSNFIANTTNCTFKYYLTENGAQTQDVSELITNDTSYLLNEVQKTLYVLVTDGFGCSNVTHLDLTLIRTPVITIKDFYYLCEHYSVSVTENAHFDSYLWSNGATTRTTTFTQPGIYTLTVTENHGLVTCSTTKTFEIILSNPATITHINFNDWTVDENFIEVIVNGLGEYEYSLDNINYQDSNIFDDLHWGEHTVYVRDKHGCGTVIHYVYLLIYPKYFTPNGDGYNDFWRIKFSENEPNIKIHIFDRYGKALKEMEANSPGWDGTYSGVPLPSTDYWFVVKRQNGKEYRGHFTLKR